MNWSLSSSMFDTVVSHSENFPIFFCSFYSWRSSNKNHWNSKIKNKKNISIYNSNKILFRFFCLLGFSWCHWSYYYTFYILSIWFDWIWHANLWILLCCCCCCLKKGKKLGICCSDNINKINFIWNIWIINRIKSMINHIEIINIIIHPHNIHSGKKIGIHRIQMKEILSLINEEEKKFYH